ncbi:MAG TPA: amino acid--tRNA ligase-related protein, partial [Planctomycetota bacterium]|nr:amino acid--tRNA ligase-related protein [Planctomycetota bacterium]
MDAPEDRLAKLERFRTAGLDPFPAGGAIARRQRISDVLALTPGEGQAAPVVSVAGRITARRDHGNSLFLDLRDESGRIQVFLRRQALGDECFELLGHGLDLGDFLAASGELGRTKMGERTVFAAEAELLTKSLAVPPKEWFGLADVETRYRQRYVDLLANAESAERFRCRSAMVADLRRFLIDRAFLEVETPILQAIAGGATARPFVTHHNTLDMDLYLRIAPELFLKRLLVGGFERVFEIGRNFRNEGLSPRHNPEFTMLEAYWAYARARDWMAALEELLPRLVERHAPRDQDRPPGPILRRGALLLDFTPPWPRRPYADLLREHAGVDAHDRAALEAACRARKLPVAGLSAEALADELFGACVEPALVQPTFVTDF